ncbi:tRNA epoxyqueuosine(34) reductase QueG [Phaeocystidibacter luteus]|uniref:Epoxyqueuosine reductase n=1 Tax=Phaeocystidibacter luteus TaxID=911197 RepID=A0A6N6RL63_9FLAO|nr:tRNA epoxyqueuosine(34) reductase QueG [Phaeocystidibacter luteus]KAB2813752.1 tRNA epoxyqueuosine(34) reductase QueG [Phaeocystidibacter luteus]
MSNPTENAQLIKRRAQELGFTGCGISKAEFLEDEAPRLERWLNQNHHGTMKWMENHFDKRLDPTLLVPGAKSVISFTLNYFPEKVQHGDAPKIAKYAYGEDYHYVIKDKLRELMNFITEEIGEVDGRAFVDSAPVLDRAWAAKSGLGWIGKHSLLLTKKEGSFFFIGELILDLELTPDPPTTDHCGSCTACMDACPTEAIIQPYVVDSKKCISYLTIELRDAIPESFAGEMNDWAFGCDICQDVCPWNRFSKPHSEPRFNPKPELLDMKREEWMEITRDVFNEVFRRSAVKRTKYEGFVRNLDFLQK